MYYTPYPTTYQPQQYIYTRPTSSIVPVYDQLLTNNVTAYVPTGATVIYPWAYRELPYQYDLNKIKSVHDKITIYFRNKTLDKWLYGTMSKLVGYFKMDGDKVSLVSNSNNFSAEAGQKDTDDVFEKKILYIENNVLTHSVMKDILKKFIKGTNANWYDLHKVEALVQDYIQKHLEQYILDMIRP